jgi:exodeoxyribonuclease V alpha subunit
MNAVTPERRPATEQISGLIERVTFHNDESGFCVLRVKAKGQRDDVTVVGSLPSVTAGEWLAAEGWWVRDKEGGRGDCGTNQAIGGRATALSTNRI